MNKHLGELELADFDLAPVWASDVAGCDEETVEPRRDLTAVPDDVHGLWVRFHGALADGTPLSGIAMAVSPPPELILHSFFVEGRWLSLLFAPAPEFVLSQEGPERFAEQLSRPIGSVFPLQVVSDVPASCDGQPIRQTISVAGPVRVTR
jgi:hypothetical protein